MSKICVLGLGYIGLPTAAMFANSGHTVIGVDSNPNVVKTLNAGDIHIEEPGLLGLVKSATESGRLVVRDTPEEADVFIIAVPTPFKHEDCEIKKADLSYVESATRSIKKVIRNNNLVILESTCPPGTTDDILLPILKNDHSEMHILVAHCPERVLPGHILKELIENNRIVGGIDNASAEAAKTLYQSFVKGDIFLTDATTAEMVKLMENTFRDVNIALANELAIICESLGINVWDVIKLANHHPRVNLHQPGPGVGGHCISVDPWFVIEQFPTISKLMFNARKINDGMPGKVVAKIEEIIKGIPDPKICLLGLTYKADVDDIRESPAISIWNELKRKKKNVSVFDPFILKCEGVCSNLEEAVKGADLVVLLVDHQKFKNLDPIKIASQMRTLNVFDTRNVLDSRKWKSSDFNYILLGKK